MATFEARKVLMKDAQGRYVIPFTGAVETVNGQKPDESGNVVIEGVDTTTLLTKAVAAETYLSKTDAASTYLRVDTAADTFLNKTDAASTYLTPSQASAAYLGIGDKAVSAETADNAVSATMASKAISDVNGNAIATTYATNQKLFQNGGAGAKLNESIMPYAYARSVNGKQPDSVGNIEIPARNVGDEWHSFTGQIPVGGVPYCGQEVTRATYADLWSWVQAQGLVKTEDEWQALNTSQKGNVPFYSEGDGSTTFRMPKVVGYIRGAASQSEAGSYAAEGLPNIVGQDSLGWSCVNDGLLTNGGTVSGALLGSKVTAYGALAYQATSFAVNETVPYGVGFDASRSNSIYGNSEHVTPETSVILFGVYAFGEITNVGALDADTLATGLATLEANKLSRDDKAEITSWCIPNYAAQIAGSTSSGALIQVDADSFVSVYSEVPYKENYGVFITRDKTTFYRVGYRFDDFNTNTQGTTFNFFAPKGWMFKCESGYSVYYYIYPLKGSL